MSGSLFDDTADSIADAMDNVEHIASPRDFVAGALTPLRFAVATLLSDLFKARVSLYWERGQTSIPEIFAEFLGRAESLGVAPPEWPDSVMPEWVHDCERCRHRGTVPIPGQLVDVYTCPDAQGTLPGGSVLARFSDDPPDYWSVPLAMLATMPGETAEMIRKVLRGNDD